MFLTSGTQPVAKKTLEKEAWVPGTRAVSSSASLQSASGFPLGERQLAGSQPRSLLLHHTRGLHGWTQYCIMTENMVIK